MTAPAFTKEQLRREAMKIAARMHDGECPSYFDKVTFIEQHLAAFALAQMEGKEAAGAERETLRAIALTAEHLCRYDGSKAMTAKGHYYDAQKAMEFSERLHELLAEWRKGQKEGRW